MINFLLTASECPECGKYDYWHFGLDYDTYERVSYCNTCGYEKRVFDQEAKETFEFLEKAIREGKLGESITVVTKGRET